MGEVIQEHVKKSERKIKKCWSISRGSNVNQTLVLKIRSHLFSIDFLIEIKNFPTK